MAFRNNKSIFVPESKKTDIYEAAGVSRRTNDRVKGVMGESAKGDPAGLAGWLVQRGKEQGSLILLYLPIFLFLLFSLFFLFFIIIKTMSKKVIANETAGAAHDKSVGTKQDPAPALEVGTLQQETTEDADGSTPLGKPAAPNQQEDGVSVSATELTTPSPTAAKTERKGLETIQPVDFEQIVLALSNTPGALDVLAKEIFKQSGSPPTGNSDDGGINDNSMFFGSPH